MTIRNFPVAQALYIKYCKEHNPQALSEIYIQEDDFNSQAELFLRESLNPTVSILIKISFCFQSKPKFNSVFLFVQVSRATLTINYTYLVMFCNVQRL